MSPDISEASDFIERLVGSADATLTFQTFDDDKNRKRRNLAQVHHGTLDEHADRLIALQQEGAGVFVMVNEGDGIIRPGRKTCRTNNSVIRVRALFVDLDGAPLAPVEAAPIPPNIIVSSSPGRYHAYWRAVDCKLDEFRGAQTLLATHFGGDTSVKDLARVMRLPGFFHLKAKPYLVRVAQ